MTARSLRLFTYSFLLLSIMGLCAQVYAQLGTNQALLLLKSNKYSDTKVTIDNLAYLGAHADHVLSNDAIIASVPVEAEPRVRLLPNVAQLYRGQAPLNAGTKAQADFIAVWNQLLQPKTMDLTPAGHPLGNDALQAPLAPSVAAASAAAPGYNQTSEFMTGTIAVGVILPESDPVSSENWTAPEINIVHAEIIEGLNFWTSQYEALYGPNNKPTFVYDYHDKASTQYEPINRSDENSWIGDVMYRMGYTVPGIFAQVRAYNNAIRTSKGTNWAFTIFVADSSYDASIGDGKFPNGTFAYAYMYGPYAVMTYTNATWGSGRMNQVCAHEIGHIFGAADEYTDPYGMTCDFGNYGYLGVPNSNCANNNPSSVSCIMKLNTLTICDSSKGQVGWRDSDADGIPDVLDNPVSLTIDSESDQGSITITGTATDIPCHSPSRPVDVTINKIEGVYYKIDNGTATIATPVDGAWNADNESYTFTTPALGAGAHRIDIYAKSTSGNVSATITRYFDPTAPIMSAVNDEGDYTYDDSRLCADWSASEPDSLISEYQYAVGTSNTDPGSGYIKSWTSTGMTPSAAATGLSLVDGQTYYFYVKAKNCCGIWSSPASSNGIAYKSISISQARLLPDGKWVSLKNKLASGDLGDFFYIQEPDRFAGIKVVGNNHPNAGVQTTVHGQISTNGNEKQIDATSIESGQQSVISPVFMINRSIGGHISIPSLFGFDDIAGIGSLYNIGLLIKTTGKVTYIDPLGCFAYVNDGSALSDGNNVGENGKSVKGVRVILPNGVQMPPVGSNVILTGVSSTQNVDGNVIRTIRLRSQADVALADFACISGRVCEATTGSFDQLIESEHPYFDDFNGTWSLNGPAGTIRMRVHFTLLELEEGCDYLYLKDKSGNIIQQFDLNPGVSDFWSDWIQGDQINLNLTTDYSAGFYGFTIDKYEVQQANNPMSGATITLTPGGRTTVTDANGLYCFNSLIPGSYTLTPSFAGATFTPTNKTVTVSEREFKPGVDFKRN